MNEIPSIWWSPGNGVLIYESVPGVFAWRDLKQGYFGAYQELPDDAVRLKAGVGRGAADEDARFKELRALEANWHHDGALPVQSGVEERARAILSALRRNSPRIYPTVEGGIQLEWGHEIEITVEPEGVSALFGDSYLEEADD